MTTFFSAAICRNVFATKSILGSVLVAALVAVAGCAGERPPGGGPIDTTPPEIIAVDPPPNTTEYSSKHISMEFSKYVERRSVEESIFISPYIKDIEFDWSGREVELDFKDSLKKNTTYVVTIGTDVVDVNNRNRMAHAFTFAFSTGQQIDRGEIRGRVVDDKPVGVMIFAYRLDGLKPDTLNPMTTKPDYISQTGNNGDYALMHLSFGNFRVLAVRDEFRNLLYDPETDAMSTAPEDIRLTEDDSLRTEMNFQLSLEDTTPPRLVSATAKDSRHVELEFSENVDLSSLNRSAFSISDTTQTRSVSIVDFFSPAQNPSRVMLIVEPRREDSLYRVAVTGVKDLAGHLINPLASSKQFTPSAGADTTPPGLIFATVMDSTTRVSVGQRFQFDFDDALQRPSAEHAITLRRKDSTDVPVSFAWNSPASFTVIPREALREDTPYFFLLRFDSLRDGSGNHWKDSTRKITIRTIDPEQLSSIEGVLLDPDSSHVDNYVVVAENTAKKMKKVIRARAERGKKFLFPQLDPGEYRLKAFQDDDRSGVYFSGKPYPFIPAERFALYPDSIKVRARWPVDGVKIKFR